MHKIGTMSDTPQKFGKYTLLERITTGGMAEVFRGMLAGSEGFRRQVAIKKILPWYSDLPDFRKMFVDEASIAARLNHANIAQIYEYDLVDDVPYIAMEFVEGKDIKSILTKCVEEDRVIPYPIAVFIAAEAAKALFYVHSRREASRPLNIVHRDVSPQNIMLSHFGEVKLVDFGIAHAVKRRAATQAGVVKGKYSYMSPEQVMGKPLDHRTDVFSLGVVLWEMLTVRRLFTGQNEADTIGNVLKTRVEQPHKVAPGVPPKLSAIVMRALARDRHDRYPTMLAFYEELSRFLFETGSFPDVSAVGDFVQELFPEEMERLVQGEHLTFDEEALADTDPAPADAEGEPVSFPEPEVEDETATEPAPRLLPSSRRKLITFRGLATAAGTLVALAAVVLLIYFALIFTGKIDPAGEPRGRPEAKTVAAADLKTEETGPTAINAAAPDIVAKEPEVEVQPAEVIATAAVVADVEAAPLADLKPPGLTVTIVTEPPGPRVRINDNAYAQGEIFLEGTSEGEELTVHIHDGRFKDIDDKLVATAGLEKIYTFEARKAYLELKVVPDDSQITINGKKQPRHPRGSYGYTGTLGEDVVVSATRGYYFPREETYTLKAGPGDDGHNTRTLRLKPKPSGSGKETDPGRQDQGIVQLQANPWAEVWYKDKKLADTTPFKKAWPVGTYTFELRHIDSVHKCKVTVVQGRRAKCRHDFLPVD